jgi:putative flippase GtrA
MLFLPLASAAAITVATVIARTLSSILNYGLNRTWCFHSSESVRRSGFRYLVLFFLQMGMSAALVALIAPLFTETLLAKILVDVSLSFFSYYVQKHWVFQRKEVANGRFQESVQPTL